MSTNVIKQTILGEPGSQTIKMVVRSNERGPKGEKGDPGPQGPQGLPGERGADGAIHYRAGTGIMISDENIIYATGGSTAEWGGIQGDIADQTDLQNALNAKQDVMADFTGTNGVISGKRGAVPAPGIDKYYSVLMGRGGWRSLGNLILKQDGTQIINFNPAMGSGTANIVSPVKIGSTSGSVAQLTNGSDTNIYPAITTDSIPDDAVTDAKIDWSSTSFGETVELTLASGITLPSTAYDGTNKILTTDATDFSGGVYMLSMPSVMVTLNNRDYQAYVSYRIDGGEWTQVVNWAYFGSDSVLNGSVSMTTPVVISSGNHTIDIGFGTNSSAKSITVGNAQTIKASLVKISY